MNIKLCSWLAITALSCTQSWAAVSPEEANGLGSSLTPLGAEKVGNEDGAIPEWTGGHRMRRIPAEAVARHPESYPGIGGQKPLFTFSSANASDYTDKPSRSHQTLLARNPGSYKMNVYPTVRSVYAPDYVYKATRENALKGRAENFGELIVDVVTGIPFPIPKDGKEVVWHHKTRHRGASIRCYNVQLVVQNSGTLTAHKLGEDVLFSDSMPKVTYAGLNGVMTDFLQINLAPPRSSGGVAGA